MHRTGPSGRVTSSAGDVDLNGDVMNQALMRRLRGSDRPAAVGFDLDAHLRRVAEELDRIRRARQAVA